MLRKRKFRKDNKVKVTFALPAEAANDHAHVAGDFNDWRASTPMKRQKDGSLRATVDLAPGRAYEFRYLIDGARWVNDPDADGYADNPFGSQNSVVRT